MELSIQPSSCVPNSQVNPLLVTWQVKSWNPLECLAANQSMAGLFAWAELPLTRRCIKIPEHGILGMTTR